MPRFLDTDPNLNCQDPRVDPVQCTRSEFQRNVSKYSSGFTQAQRIASSAGLFSIIVSAGRKNVFDAMWWQQFPPNIRRRHEGLAIAQYREAGELSTLERRFPTDITFSILSSPSFPETNVASAYGRSRGLLCRVEEGGGEEEKTRGTIFKYGDDNEKNLGFYHCF